MKPESEEAPAEILMIGKVISGLAIVTDDQSSAVSVVPFSFTETEICLVRILPDQAPGT